MGVVEFRFCGTIKNPHPKILYLPLQRLELVTDYGSVFASSEFEEFLKKNGIHYIW